MNPALQQLKDIHLPPPISLWPPAPGWIILLALLLALIGYCLSTWFKNRKQKYPGKFALKQLQQLEQYAEDTSEKAKIAAEISILLRRTALHYFPRRVIAGLSGQAWIQFLKTNAEKLDFPEEITPLLTDAPYQSKVETDLSPLFAYARAWIVIISKKKTIAVEKY